MASKASGEGFAAGLACVRTTLTAELMAPPCSLTRTQATTGLATWLAGSPPNLAAVARQLQGSMATAMMTLRPLGAAGQATGEAGGPAWKGETLSLTVTYHTQLGVPGAMLQLATTAATPFAAAELALPYCAAYHSTLTSLVSRHRSNPLGCAPAPANFTTYVRDLRVLLDYAEGAWRTMSARQLGSFASIVTLMHGAWTGAQCDMHGFPMGRLATLVATVLDERGSEYIGQTKRPGGQLSECAPTCGVHTTLACRLPGLAYNVCVCIQTGRWSAAASSATCVRGGWTCAWWGRDV